MIDLAEVLAEHAKWLNDTRTGERANLRGANLCDADLSGANLCDANLRGANLCDADLSGANLCGANLCDANLRDADLRRADLSDADLSGANLRRADLSDADLSDADLPNYAICPEEGSFTAYKKLSGGIIATLEVPAEARRTSSLVGRKCRAEFVRVLSLSGGTEALSRRDFGTVYRVGEIVRPDSYNPDIRVECTHGIHFFITRREAEEY